ncbi:3-oxoacyl-(acyl-carrier-protein) reductase [Blastocystis sp. subtype 4]|uniref:3-oxoacyl-(acyl-carrier-protein) reductase n=1 Tax=Blastocystis sp. subtype 4 TaxID=944170 RepID=UPI0007121F66|nr:3-oxoacyl-(acyl-carrier-protein) reductase [Blastocystis sp. subtype 4]KNB46266.1 3-oxoacyl-(acyl-carrier-protein) reductase [Blastocystis sp. subtype 4]|eukprot:XP_014529707.1 3-oxoacyl-(acyl-carrier-protein) reductase [Blastocystis sp. subtype 4]
MQWNHLKWNWMHIGSLIPNSSSFLRVISGMRKRFSYRNVVKVNCRQSISRITNEIGYPTHLVNVAGINKDGIFIKYKHNDIQALIQTNLVGTMIVTQSVLPYMMKSKYGSIVNIGSVVGTGGRAGQSVYAATKSALIGYSRSLAKEMGRYNVRVNVVAPGFIQTEMTQSIKDRDVLLNQIALHRIGTVEDVANTVSFLLSDAASYISGTVLHVDGGMEIWYV